MVFGLSFGIEK